MALHLSNLFNYRTTSPVNGDAGTVGAGTAVNSKAEAAKAAEVLSRLTPGQTLQGTIVSMDGEGIQLLLAEGQSIKASVGGGMNLAVGQSLFFSVVGNSQSRVSLTPLFFNMEQGLNAQKALEEAGLPENDRNLAFVASMMEEGMPIDKESLLQMNRFAGMYPDEPIQNLVQMVRIGMPLTPENVEQFAQYKNLEHQLVVGMDSVMEELSSAYAQVREAGGGTDFYKALLDAFLPEQDAQDGAAQDAPRPEEAVVGTQPGAAAPQTGAAAGGTVSGDTVSALAQEVGGGALRSEGVKPEGDAPPLKPDAPTPSAVSVPLSQVLTEPERGELFRALGRKPEEMEAAKPSVQDTLQLVRDSLNNGWLSKDAAQKIFDHPSFSKLVRQHIESEWLLKPADAQNQQNVTKLYERLRSQTQKLADALTPFVKGDSAVMKSVTNLRNNVDFMNQLNQMFTYVQLPLKMGSFQAHGDLYVYTNKRSLAKKDGNVSALLHLDMEHLGKMDVYVAMQGEKVNTRFYLPDEETIDFLAEHMDELNERLEKRGYQAHSELVTKERPDKETSVMEEILKENRNVMAVGVGTYSFDLRA